MKKLLLFHIGVWLSVIGLWAQSSTPSTGKGDYDQTYVIARLAFNGELLSSQASLLGIPASSITTQAYIEGESMSEAVKPTLKSNGANGASFYYYMIPVINTTVADCKGKEMEFRLALGDYALGIVTELAYTGTTTTYGSLSEPVVLDVAAPTVISPLQVAQGITVSLAKNITYPEHTPIIYTKEGEQMDAPTAQWSFVSDNAEDYVSLNAETGELTSLQLTGEETPIVIKATFEGLSGWEQTLEVFVLASDVEGLTINEDAGFPEVMYLGESYPLTNDYVTFEPVYATDQSLTWSVSDESMATLAKGDAPGTFILTPQQTGILTITATSNDNPEYSVSWTVRIESRIQSIALNNQAVTIEVDETLALDTFIDGYDPADATLHDIAWRVDDESLAQVFQRDGKWYVTGLRVGNTFLTAYAVDNPDVQSHMSLNIICAVETIKALHPEQTVFLNDYVDLSYEITPADAADRYVVWSANDPDAFTFTYDPYTYAQQIFPTKSGDYTLTGTPDEGEHTCTITVHAVKHVETIDLTTTERLTVDAGKSLPLDGLVVFTPEDAYNKEVIWTSNNEGVATVTCNAGHWMVNGISSGITMLNVVSDDNPDAMARIEVSVIRRVTGITVEEPEQVLYPGDYVNTIYTILPEDADNMDVTFSVSDEDILGFDDNEIDNFTYLKALRPGEATVTITTDEGGFTATIHVTVAKTIEEIELSTDTISLDIDETIDLNDYITAILPEDALDKDVYWIIGWTPDAYMTIAEDGHTATTLKETREPFQISVHAQSGYAYKYVWVEIYRHPKRIVVDQPEQAVEVYDILNLGYKILPEDARYNPEDIVWTSSEKGIVYLGHDVYATHRTEEINAKAMMAGTTTLTVSLPKEGISATIHVTVTAPEPEDIMCDLVDIMKGETGRAIVRTYPDGAYADPDKLEISLQNANGRWTPCLWTTGTDESGKTYIDVEALSWGEYTLDVAYPGTRGSTLGLSFGQGIELEKGWNWVSLGNALATIDGLARISDAFDDKLNDARTQYDLLYNDPEIGVFGTLTRFDAGSYKMEVTDDHYLENHCLRYMLNDSLTASYDEGWTWMWYPYDQSYTLDELTANEAFKYAYSGDRIVAKDDGFAEYDGSKWNGTLTELKESVGYMYYSPSGYINTWPAPIKLGQKNPNLKGTSRRTTVGGESIWKYDHRRFADNMTIIATLSGVTFPDDCTIGAFVNGECRGAGHYVDGRFFITVHGNAGEKVSFIVHDDATDTYYTVPGMLNFDFMAGSLQRPVGLQIGDKTTDITIISNADEADVLYDLVGRRVVSPAPGYYIQNGKLILVK